MEDNDPRNTKIIRDITMHIERSLCIGAATCVAVAPKAWTLDDEAKAIILPTAEETTDDILIEAAKSCPVMAIILTDKNGKQIYP